MSADRTRARLALALVALIAPPAHAQVEGGIYDKPFLDGTGPALSLGGYIDAQMRHARVEGLIDETTFAVERFNLFAYAVVSDRVRVAAELEVEEGGEALKIELAVVDFELHPALSVRGGILLSPLGRFNLAHDSPANDLVDRPLVSTEIIAATLSEPGMGIFGAVVPSASSRVTYELYAVNGFGDGVIAASDLGTHIPAGKDNWEDNNARPALVGRLGVSPVPPVEVGLSAHTGAYNTFAADGLAIDARRDLTIGAVDVAARWRGVRLTGEAARASIDVPATTGGLFATTQQGVYLEVSMPLLEGVSARLPESTVRLAVRGGMIDRDADIAGETVHRLTTGVSFRPSPETVFKLDWQRSWSKDAFAILENEAAILFGVASYF